jgi:hypothetical protein
MKLLVPAFLLLALVSCGGESAAQAPGDAERIARPRLVVVLSVDQLRADYLTRWEDLLLPPRVDGKVGGLRWLMSEGAWFTDARHEVYPTHTAPGHAVLLTGAPPCVSGVVGNGWYDRGWKRFRYSVEPAPRADGGTGESPEALLVTTVGDELEMATGGRAKTWSLGQKDRAAILMGGHLPDGAFWFDDATGGWAHSAWYGGAGSVPSWLRAWNDERKPDSAFGATWTCGVGPEALARCWTPSGDPRPEPFAVRLDHGRPISQGGAGRDAQTFYRSWTQTPFAIDWVLASAARCVEAEGLGQDAAPDLLSLNISTLDYLGHGYGPDAPFVVDAVVRVDLALAQFLRTLDASVPGGLASCTVVVTSDHGVAPNHDKSRRARLPSGSQVEPDPRVGASPQRDAVEKALDTAHGADDWVLSHVDFAFWLSADACRRRGVTAEQAERTAADAVQRLDGVHAAFTRTQILDGRLPPTDVGRSVALGFHRRNSGDVVYVPDPLWTPDRGPQSTTHGSPWPYDAHVPLLLAGHGLRAGRFRERVATTDLAPTLAELLGVGRPSGCQGRVLSPALR